MILFIRSLLRWFEVETTGPILAPTYQQWVKKSVMPSSDNIISVKSRASYREKACQSRFWMFKE